MIRLRWCWAIAALSALFMYTLWALMVFKSSLNRACIIPEIITPPQTRSTILPTQQVLAAATLPPSPSPLLTPVIRHNITIGLCTKLPIVKISIIVQSFRSHNRDPNDLLIILIHEDDARKHEGQIRALKAEYSVDFIEFSGKTLAERYGAKAEKFHPSSYRWLMIRDALLPYKDNTWGVFMLDLNDAVFQSSPFAMITKPGIYFFMETGPRPISACGWNTKWVQECFGNEGMQKVGREMISCSGTVAATMKEAIAYANAVGEELLHNSCEQNGADQGVHNYLLHSNYFAKFNISTIKLSNEEGPVLTMQGMPTLKFDRLGRMINDRGQVAAVVHQTNRNDQFQKWLERRYPIYERDQVELSEAHGQW